MARITRKGIRRIMAAVKTEDKNNHNLGVSLGSLYRKYFNRSSDLTRGQVERQLNKSRFKVKRTSGKTKYYGLSDKGDQEFSSGK
jgi:hypothetical protein